MPQCAHGECCYHEQDRHTYRAGDVGTMTKTERCCWCGNYQVQHFRLVKDTTHGPHAGLRWRFEEKL